MAIEHVPYGRVAHTPGNPPLLLQSVVSLPCGCGFIIGHRLDTHEPATRAGWCSPAHQQVIRHAHLLLRESLVEPTARDLADVCDDMLGQAARAHGVAA